MTAPEPTRRSPRTTDRNELGSRARPGSRQWLIENLLKKAGWRRRQVIADYPLQERPKPPSVTRRHHHGPRPDLVAYVLSSKPGTPTAVFATVGAQHDPEKSLARAIRQASLLDVPLACATNGHDIVEHFSSSRRTVRIKLPSSPTRAWRAYMRLHGLSPEDRKSVV
jgi:type I site-specific restriction endonuclease